MNICFMIGSDYVPDDKDFDFSLFDVDEDEEQNAPLTSEPLTLATPSVSRKQKPNNFAKTCSWHTVRSNCSARDCRSWLGQLPPVESVKRPIEYFREFLSNDILESIVMQSNSYAVQEDSSKPLALTKNELEYFLGTLFAMSLVKL